MVDERFTPVAAELPAEAVGDRAHGRQSLDRIGERSRGTESGVPGRGQRRGLVHHGAEVGGVVEDVADDCSVARLAGSFEPVFGDVVLRAVLPEVAPCDRLAFCGDGFLGVAKGEVCA